MGLGLRFRWRQNLPLAGIFCCVMVLSLAVLVLLLKHRSMADLPHARVAAANAHPPLAPPEPAVLADVPPVEIFALAAPAQSPPVRARAEWEPVGSVIVGYQGIEDWGQELVTRVLQTGAQLIVIVPDEFALLEEDKLALSPDEIFELVLESATALGLEERVRFIPHSTVGGWVRDFAPYSVETIVEGRRRVELVDARYSNHRRPDELFPSALVDWLAGEEGVKSVRREVPIFIEWGNFMTDGQGGCAMTDNAHLINDHLAQPLAGVVRHLERSLGCVPDRLLMFPVLDLTIGHIDEVAKFLPNRGVLVSTLRVPQRVDGRPMFLTEAEEAVALALDDMALSFEEAGYEVSRVPSLPPPADGEEDAILRSYVNSLIVNKHVILPSYIHSDAFFRGVDILWLEGLVKRVYSAALPGYELLTVEVSGAVQLDGSVHCLTMGLPDVL